MTKLPKGTTFGLVDNGILVVGAYLGFDIGDAMGKALLGAVLGAAIGNTISDALGALIDPTMRDAALGITLGCLIPVVGVLVIEYFV